jgi:hypothetical protein
MIVLPNSILNLQIIKTSSTEEKLHNKHKKSVIPVHKNMCSKNF